MTYSRPAAKRVLSAAELELFDAARRPQVGTLSAAQLRANIARTRRLRDKYRDLYRRQRVSTRARTGTKAGVRGAANLRTRQKGEIFGELLVRFEERLALMQAAQRRAELQAAKRARRAGKAAGGSERAPIGKARSGGAVGRTGFVSPRAKLAETKRQAVQTGRVAIHAHIGSRTRRNQAKRDQRS